MTVDCGSTVSEFKRLPDTLSDARPSWAAKASLHTSMSPSFERHNTGSGKRAPGTQSVLMTMFVNAPRVKRFHGSRNCCASSEAGCSGPVQRSRHVTGVAQTTLQLQNNGYLKRLRKALLQHCTVQSTLFAATRRRSMPTRCVEVTLTMANRYIAAEQTRTLERLYLWMPCACRRAALRPSEISG
jgi:hypothetical protein